ncbi:MAG: glycosyltransferase family 1 protein [Daejeonella sp.]
MTKTLIVGIDIRDLKIAKTGAKTYLEEIYYQFSKHQYNNCRFHFFDTSLPIYTGRNKLLKLIEHIRFIFWKQVILPIRAWIKNCDILFCTDYFVPYILLGYKTIPVFHDAFFWEYPQHYNLYWLKMFKYLGLNAAKRSSFIITPTNYTKKQLTKFTKIDADKIIPIHLAPKTLPATKTSVSFIENIDLPASKYILHVGTLEKRKNLVRLIEAFYLLRKEGYNYTLILIGQASPKNDMDGSRDIKNAISQYNLEKYIITKGYLPDHQLAWFYKNAELYVFPSVNEGFGLPVLEAFQYNLPVIVANNTCLTEVGGNAVLSFDPYDSEDIKQKMKEVIDNPELKVDMMRRGEERLKLFSWEKTAQAIVQVFENAAKK